MPFPARLRPALLLGLGALLSAGPVLAQARPIPGRGPTPQNPPGTPIPGVQQGPNGPGQPGVPGQFPGPGYLQNGGPNVRIIPPEPLLPNSLGLLERDFMYMRSQAPRPNEFLHGRWNPRVEITNRTPLLQFPPGYGYGFGYGGFGTTFVGFGNPFAAPTVVQREVVILREGNGYGNGAGSGSQEQPRGNRKPEAEGQPSGTTEETRATEGFYLNRRPAVAEALPAALEEIRRSWLNGDFTKMSARFRLEGKVRVFPRGQFKYAVDTKEFTTMLKEAMARIDTLAFAFHAPRALRPDRVFVTGRHLFLDADKIRQETNISYVLERTDGRWFIVEAGSSNAPIVDHQE